MTQGLVLDWDLGTADVGDVTSVCVASLVYKYLWSSRTCGKTSSISAQHSQMSASKQDIENRKVRSTLSISLLRRRGWYHIQPLPLHTYVNMFGLRGEECALRLPYEISGPFPRRLPFMPPLAKRADAAASIIQPQFSCSGATCYGSVVPGSLPQAAAAMRGLTSLMGWQEIAVKRSKVPVTALMKAGHGGFFGVSVSQKKHVDTFAFLFYPLRSGVLHCRHFIYLFIYYFAASCQRWFCSRYRRVRT